MVAKCYCHVMFALKIILKILQRIDITPEYVDSVLVQESGKGNKAMKLANKVGVDIYHKNICILSECKEIN